jgi:uncharacterized ion transporter superfamily protein YfcC
MESGTVKEKKVLKLPHVFVIMLILMIFVSILTYVVPSGQYTRVRAPDSAIAVVDPVSYHDVDKTPVSPWDFFTSIYKGFVEGAVIMGSLLLCSGSLGVLQATGTFAAGIQKLIRSTRGKEMIVVTLFYLFFILFGALGSGEAAYPMYPLVVAVFISMGYDRMVGTAVCMFGSTVGFTAGLFNLFTTGISQQIVGLPMYSGLGYRMISMAVFFAIGMFFLVSYCSRIRKNPDLSVMGEEYLQQKTGDTSMEEVPLTTKRIIAWILYAIAIGGQVVGALKYSWGLAEISSVYVIYAVILAILFRMKADDACASFLKGSSTVLGAALTIGLARSVMILLNQGNITDTFVKVMSDLLVDTPMLTILVIYLFVTIFNFFVVSGSGKAVIMMPILSPLGQILKINQQVLVLTYQFGDGMTNSFWPGGAMIPLALCGVNYGTWFKFCWKAYVCFIAAGYVMALIAHLVGIGPF